MKVKSKKIDAWIVYIVQGSDYTGHFGGKRLAVDVLGDGEGCDWGPALIGGHVSLAHEKEGESRPAEMKDFLDPPLVLEKYG